MLSKHPIFNSAVSHCSFASTGAVYFLEEVSYYKLEVIQNPGLPVYNLYTHTLLKMGCYRTAVWGV